MHNACWQVKNSKDVYLSAHLQVDLDAEQSMTAGRGTVDLGNVIPGDVGVQSQPVVLNNRGGLPWAASGLNNQGTQTEGKVQVEVLTDVTSFVHNRHVVGLNGNIEGTTGNLGGAGKSDVNGVVVVSYRWIRGEYYSFNMAGEG
eukprot:NODE_2156_length_639_cov_107.330078_g2106_i0.p1 GENE.NODE_2156_length_639_cov_107.330078_g2106_i0~~NODE_2156_length_639_cov_107.330078_g2106_i0.p1  ORF type:complete len:160 (-),score=34.30 NODE_2156_length_639_cov_107.330078_g2106_i0:160-591(-)